MRSESSGLKTLFSAGLGAVGGARCVAGCSCGTAGAGLGESTMSARARLGGSDEGRLQCDTVRHGHTAISARERP